MALNFPGPYEVRLNYTVGIYQHTARLNFEPSAEITTSQAFDSIQAVNNLGTTSNLQAEIDSYVAAIRPFFASANSTIVNAEVWKMTPNSFSGVFVKNYNINLPGTSAGATAFASQLIWTFRTREGGIMKASLLNTTNQPGASLSYANAGTAQKTWADEFVGGISIWLARDTSYPSTAMFFHPGQNEALFKKIYRPN